ncbi:MAG TPA: molybdate ABC transporter substrate-binding protein [Dehalococcoidia bacterium]|nr:molybdate ABC transporter substrate-binding protein [Dehalococcoidia bacterium]
MAEADPSPSPAAARPFTPIQAPGKTVTVFAAASLTDAFNELGEMYTRATGARVELNVGASNTLREQLAQGARADVFASANVAEMNNARRAGLVAGEAPTFVRNRLVVITPHDNPGQIETLRDLGEKSYKLVLAAPNVPVGAYARDMLTKLDADPAFGAGFKDRVLANLVSDEPNVRQVVAKVQLGEGDAGVVYTSDVTPQVAPALQLIDVPDAFNTVAAYPIAVLEDAPDPALAQNFVKYVLSDEGQAALQTWGFIRARS